MTKFLWSLLLLAASSNVDASQRISNERSDFYLRLAQHYAPIIYQETGKKPKADAITRVDFDGDFVANNNWKNMNNYTSPAYVYFDVIESVSHYYISYSLFHARDYTQFICFFMLCHENDLEGIWIVVRKERSQPYGQIDLVALLAHTRINTHLDPSYSTSPIMNDPYGDHQRVAIRVQKGGHGIYRWDHKEDNSKRLIYTYGHTADDPNGAKNGVYRYDLIPTWDLWKMRTDVGKGQLFSDVFTHTGARFSAGILPSVFGGEKYGAFAKPPWAWSDNRDTVIKKGDWFLDPAFATWERLGQPRDFTTEYLYNPYLDIIPEN